MASTNLLTGNINWNNYAPVAIPQAPVVKPVQIKAPAPPKTTGLGRALSDAGNWLKTGARDTGGAVEATGRQALHAGVAIVKPVSDIELGKGGQLVHDTSQLSNDVTGGTVNQLARGLVNVPTAVHREVQNKPISDIQQNAFGTTNPFQIGKKIVGSTVGTASLFAGGDEIAGLKDTVMQGAKAVAKQSVKDAAIGGIGNAASAAAEGKSGKSIIKSGIVGAAFGTLPLAVNRIHTVLSHINTPFVNHVYQALSDHINTIKAQQNAADVATKVGMQKLSTAQTKAQSAAQAADDFKKNITPTDTKLLGSGETQTPKLLQPGSGNFTISSQENARVMNGTEQLATQYSKEYNQLTKTFANSPKRLNAEVESLDQKYIGRHENLMNGVGEFAPQIKTSTPKTLGNTITTVTGKTIPRPRSALDNLSDTTETSVTTPKESSAPTNLETPKTAEIAPKQATAKISDLTSYEGAPDAAQVAKYKADIESGKPIQPILVKKDSLGNLGVEDGKHRLEAARQAGLDEVPIKDVTQPAQKTSGSALKSEQRAVESKLATQFEGKAKYNAGSYKTEAAKAVQLTHDDPDKAMKIAMGDKSGDNTMHEVAVRHAVENKAIKDNDVDTLTRLASSSQHTETSEAAQRLGAEGYATERDSPVRAISEIQKSRAKALASRTGKDTNSAVESTIKDIKTKVAPIKRQEWHQFIESLRC